MNYSSYNQQNITLSWFSIQVSLIFAKREGSYSHCCESMSGLLPLCVDSAPEEDEALDGAPSGKKSSAIPQSSVFNFSGTTNANKTSSTTRLLAQSTTRHKGYSTSTCYRFGWK
mgnify:CR=1 FL=1